MFVFSSKPTTTTDRKLKPITATLSKIKTIVTPVHPTTRKRVGDWGYTGLN